MIGHFYAFSILCAKLMINSLFMCLESKKNFIFYCLGIYKIIKVVKAT